MRMRREGGFEEVGMMVVGGGGAKTWVARWGRESGRCGG